MSLDKLLAATRETKAKDSVPNVEVCGLAEKVAKLKKHKEAIKDAEAAAGVLAVEIADLLEPERLRLSRAKGSVVTSVRAAGCTYTRPEKFRTIDYDRRAELMERAGAEYETLFTTRVQVKVNPEKLTDELVELLIQTGAASTTAVIEPTEEYHRRATLFDSFSRSFQGLVRYTDPTIRV